MIELQQPCLPRVAACDTWAMGKKGRDLDALCLDVLDPPAWSAELEYDSFLVRRLHELRLKPVGEFSVEDLRIVIGQRRSLEQLVPRALKRLVADPLVAGDLYEGDLLSVVLRVDADYWSRHPDLARSLQETVRPLLEPGLVYEVYPGAVSPLDQDLRELIETFLDTCDP
jgi:contact-dependent growth inhibition (CDI) system CdiI-like immunity protein